MTLDLCTEFSEILKTVKRAGSFCASGTASVRALGLEVEGVGRVAFPLLDAQCGPLKAAAEPAPYGKGEQTLVDPDVRRTWQIGVDRLKLVGRAWPHDLEAIVAAAAAGLGVSGRVEAGLYKLLLYDEGCFFVPHRDTEKAAGMFATLVVVLPSLYEGGELVVRHRDREERLTLRSDDPGEVAWAAFYADCVHEVRPLTRGCRLALIYNLVRSQGPSLKAPDSSADVERLAARLASWDGHDKLVYVLEHAYTPAELSFDALKGVDAARAQVVRAAASQADCDVALALLTVEERGLAEHMGPRRRWGVDDDLEAVEVHDRKVSLSAFRFDVAGGPPLEAVPVDEGELSPTGCLDDLAFDSEHFHEATGNEGASFERTYRRGALVVWPRANRLAVLAECGLGCTLPLLEALVARRDDPASAEEARELAKHVIRLWTVRGHQADRWDLDDDEDDDDEDDDDDNGDDAYDDEDHDAYEVSSAPGHAASTPLARFLAAMMALDDHDRIEEILIEVCASSRYCTADRDAVVRALSILEPARAALVLDRIVQAQVPKRLDVCADLLAASPDSITAPAARALVAALPTSLARHDWEVGRAIGPPLVGHLLRALHRLDSSMIDEVVRKIVLHPATYDPDKTVIPALLSLEPHLAAHPAVKALTADAVAHLRARIAQPLSEPTDWKRDDHLTCRCTTCDPIRYFLADPEVRAWKLKAPEAIRTHVEHTVRASASDVDVSTEKTSRPYVLVLTKNRASYERRTAQRARDLDHLTRLIR